MILRLLGSLQVRSASARVNRNRRRAADGVDDNSGAALRARSTLGHDEDKWMGKHLPELLQFVHPALPAAPYSRHLGGLKLNEAVKPPAAPGS